MATKKNRDINKDLLFPKARKRASQSSKKNLQSTKVLRTKTKDKSSSIQVNVLLISLVKAMTKVLESFKNLIFKFLQNIAKAPFLFINIFFSYIIEIFKKIISLVYTLLEKLFASVLRFREVLLGGFFGIISGAIGAVLAISYIELGSNNKENEVSDNFKQITEDIKSLDERLKNTELQNKKNDSLLANLKVIESEINKSENNFSKVENEMAIIGSELEKVKEKTANLGNNISVLKKDLRSNSRLILSSSKTELSNRLYLAQSLLDRLESGVPYSPQLEALGKEGLDPALLRYAAGGAPTLKDLEARLSARAGEQFDADRTKRDSTWRENLRKEISKYVKIKPTNINEIKGVTGALLRAESSISRGDLAKAIKEISSVPLEERGPLDAWLTEAKARQNADIAAKNLLARTTAALKQKN
ncbi:MAG: hypothetical protein CFH34_00365 [Alphaproteobacteria bacterium MarineAlpha9_Bin4]|nr:hypothetical protein [Pelagibacterales bacterium]PPR27245.1 MAG: hypothetical protein CFH34_00365 [Alphaproteobacteria bacterium MarineAlpha9_Bin4]|tara:strand:- start:3221 stop:4474 length:1254 start_codon:yes stop_codon:yes gene_type:complete